MTNRRPGRLLAASTVLMIVLAPARADDPPGVLWEMNVPGVHARHADVAAAEHGQGLRRQEWTRPPPGGDSSCVNSNFQRSGNKATWDMQCSGQMPMTGHGEITFESEDTYSGVIDATAEGMSMKINLSGTKLGTCDKPVG